MEIINNVSEMQQFSRRQRLAGKKIAVVPTMGYLHEGHLSLVDEANKQADVVILTIFVNPTQFGPNEDFACYPRNFASDCKLCEERNVTAIFVPESTEIYAPDNSTIVEEQKLSRGLCGASRPGHFRGVTTIVAKLFNITLPDVAVFGRKDAQQALVIQRMARDLNFPIEIVIAPLVRESDGLAMSSRNRYLSADEHQRALAISRSLFAAEQQLKADGIEDPVKLTEKIRTEIESAGGKVDYIEALDADSLENISGKTCSVLIAVAAFFGKTRLIDNVIVDLDKS